MDLSENILRQLRWIKWLVALIALCFVIIAASIGWGAIQIEKGFRSGERTPLASEDTLLEQGREREVLKLAEEREKDFPKDPYVYWHRGRAHYQLGEYESALKALRHLKDLAPNWRDEHAKPYIEAAEEKLRTKR